jgi:serine protease Do
VIIDAEGYVLTAAHILDLAETVSVRLADGRTLAASIVGSDMRSNVALLKIPGQGYTAAPAGEARKLRLGERVFAAGMLYNRSSTVTDGIVSTMELEDGGAAGLFQTTAPLLPSMGGGPLFNLAGQVVGVNSMMYQRDSNSSLSYAIPVEDALAVAKELRASGRVRRGTMGVNLQEVTPMIAATYGMDRAAGVMAVTVNPGSPAAQAGIQQGDLLLRIGGEALRSVNHAVRVVARTRPGDRIVVRVRRMKDVREEDLTVTLAEASDK